MACDLEHSLYPVPFRMANLDYGLASLNIIKRSPAYIRQCEECWLENQAISNLKSVHFCILHHFWTVTMWYRFTMTSIEILGKRSIPRNIAHITQYLGYVFYNNYFFELADAEPNLIYALIYVFKLLSNFCFMCSLRLPVVHKNYEMSFNTIAEKNTRELTNRRLCTWPLYCTTRGSVSGQHWTIV